MNRAAFALLALLSGYAAQAQETQPECDPAVELHEVSNWWDADRFSVRWRHWMPDRANVGLTAHTYNDHDRHHLETDGPFSRWSNNLFSAAPKIMRTRGELWAQLSVGGRSLAPAEVSRRNGFYGLALFKAHEVMDLVGDAPELTITFYDRKQVVIDRYAVPRATIEAGAAQMMSVYRDYRGRLAEPQAQCPQETILVH